MKLEKIFCTLLLSCSMLLGIENNLLATKDCPVSLSYQQIFDDYWPTESEAIQHQFLWQQFLAAPSMKELEIIKDLTIPLKPEFIESKASPNSDVYGYHRNGDLDLDGGAKKSYNRNFKKFRLRYHGALESKYPSGDPQDPVITQPLSFLDPETVEYIYKHTIPYFVQRGFDIQGDDIPKKFKSQYIWTFPAGQTQEFGVPPGYIALRLVWGGQDCSYRYASSSEIPAFVDLHATSNSNLAEYFVLDTYQRKECKHKNGYGYPTRIPVTTNFCHFKKFYNVQPIAFYDKENHVLTVHVPNTDTTEHFLTRRLIDVGNPDLNVDYIEHLAGFNGSFKVLRREKSGKLVASSLKCADVFAQVSEVVTIRSRVIHEQQNGGNPEFYEFENPIRAPVLDETTLSYTGVVAGSMNGDSGAYDNYSTPFPDLNAFAVQLDPVDLPEQEINNHRFGRGDNPVSRIVERYSSLSSITFFDNPAWNLDGLRLPLDVLKGKISFPENVSTTAIPTDVSAVDDYLNVSAHEFTHQTQYASGALIFLPFEAMAVGIELDPHAAGNVFAPFRSAVFTQRLIRTLRGEFSAMTPDVFGLSTYGMAIWWKYIQDQFDFNNQVMRRTMDVLSNEMIGPLMEENNFPDSFAVDPVNDVGGSAAIDRALDDLFGKNIKDVWNDYSISATLLRNNTSIPAKWRNYFPYWIYNTEYSGYNKIFEVNALYGLERFADWWEKMDNNAVIPANYNTPYTGETFIRTLPEHFEAEALSLRTFAFNVTLPSQGGPDTIHVTVPLGEWRVTLVQFTSDGTPVGSFIADGPHTLIAGGNNTLTLNVAGHTPAFSETGNIRLICVNVTFSGTGKQLNEYFTDEVPNGRIIIDAPVDIPVQAVQKKKMEKSLCFIP